MWVADDSKYLDIKEKPKYERYMNFITVMIMMMSKTILTRIFAPLNV